MPNPEYAPAEVLIRQLPPDLQTRLALALATLVQPFASMSEDGQPSGGLGRVAAQIRAAESPAKVDRARHILWSVPELDDADEPEGPAWFALGATVTWIYAADSKCNSPSDGAVNAFRRVTDLLDCADETLGHTKLTDDLVTAVTGAARSGEPLPQTLFARVAHAVDRLRPLTQ